MQTVPNYRTSVAPDKLNHRYLREDVCSTLVLMHYLAKLAGVETPIADAIVYIAQVLTGENFLQTGRTLDKLGWSKLSYSELKKWIS